MVCPTRLAEAQAFAEADLQQVLKNLNTNEKISLLAGADWWNTVSIPRLGIPNIKCSDGPNGVRGSSHYQPVPAHCIPCATALAASFDVDTAHQAGQLLALEARAKGSSLLLGPTCNIQRNPLNGRAFESFSEDPWLSGLMAAAYINGLQENHVGATVKHFVCNDQEDERYSVDTLVPERALREIYLLPFQIACKLAKPWGIMTSYNRVNGIHCSEDDRLLDDVVRKEWRYSGFFMSDWRGTYSIDKAINAGLDLEMPGPTVMRGKRAQMLILAGKIKHQTVDNRALNVLRLVKRACGADSDLVSSNILPETSSTSPGLSVINRRLAADAVVLLKNERSILPLERQTIRSIAVVGPNAKCRSVSGGGSACLLNQYVVTPLQGIMNALAGSEITIKYAPGCYTSRYLPLLDGFLRNSLGTQGWTATFYHDDPSSGAIPVAVNHIKTTNIRINDEKPKGLDDIFYAVLEGSFQAEATEIFEFGLCLVGRGRLYINDSLIIDNGMETNQKLGTSFYGYGSEETKGTYELESGRLYTLKLEYTNTPATQAEDASRNSGRAQPPLMVAGIRLGGCPLIREEEAMTEACDLANASDAVVCFVGTDSDWEEEASDRQALHLPGRTDEFVARLCAANQGKVIVVNQSGSAVYMPWLEDAGAVLQAWFLGNETGNGIADVLFGKHNPSARMPISFPKDIRHCTGHLNWGSESGKVLYGEGIFVGYRGYDETDREAMFAFGDGLSYSTFKWRNFKVTIAEGATNADDVHLSVSLEVTNTSRRPGRDVVQIYIRDVACTKRRPLKELKAFSKTGTLEPGATEILTFSLDKYALSFYDDEAMTWLAEAGEFEVSARRSAASQSYQHIQKVRLQNSLAWRGL